jgi:hypothetical protein
VNAYHVWGFAGWVYIWTIAFTGMRPPGEMFALQRGFGSAHWPGSDRDKDRRKKESKRYEGMHVLRVQHQMYYVEGQPTLAPPKVDSYRSIVIPRFLHEMHCALLDSHDKPWMFLSKRGRDHLLGVGFTKEYWYPIRDGRKERTVEEVRYPQFAVGALPAVEEMAGQDIYRLRHWHKEILDESGDIPRVAVEARLGHELPGMEGVYSNVTVAMEQRIVEYLQGVWEKRVVAQGLWRPPFPIASPDDLLGGLKPLFSGLPVLGLQ